ncbi:MAG: hypothetical protein C0412_01820 [Flavobacterium sp.]|nr:hypothetical protein [Flavobacterium sp.]
MLGVIKLKVELKITKLFWLLVLFLSVNSMLAQWSIKSPIALNDTSTLKSDKENNGIERDIRHIISSSANHLFPLKTGNTWFYKGSFSRYGDQYAQGYTDIYLNIYYIVKVGTAELKSDGNTYYPLIISKWNNKSNPPTNLTYEATRYYRQDGNKVYLYGKQEPWLNFDIPTNDTTTIYNIKRASFRIGTEYSYDSVADSIGIYKLNCLMAPVRSGFNQDNFLVGTILDERYKGVVAIEKDGSQPIQVYPLNSAIVNSDSITYKWAKYRGAVSYRLILQELKRPPQATGATSYNRFDVTTTDTLIKLPANPDYTSYRWIIEANMGEYSVQSVVSEFVKLKSAPTILKTNLIYPTNNAVLYAPTNTFRWQKLAAAKTYKFVLQNLNGTTPVVESNSTISDTCITVTLSQDSIHYRWYVETSDGLNLTQSDIFDFTKQKTPDIITGQSLIYPQNNALISSCMITFRWQKSPAAKTYRFILQKLNSTPTVTVTDSEISNNYITLLLDNPAANYQWTVEAKNELYSSQSEPFYFAKTETDTSGNIVPVSFQLFQNYPNPFNNGTMIKYGLHEKRFVTVKIYDMIGKEVTTLVNEEKPPGYYEVHFNTRNLSSGVYFCLIQAEEFRQTIKMVLLK